MGVRGRLRASRRFLPVSVSTFQCRVESCQRNAAYEDRSCEFVLVESIVCIKFIVKTRAMSRFHTFNFYDLCAPKFTLL